MPGRATHEFAGSLTAIAVAATMPSASIVSVGASYFIGKNAGRIPDLLEPATSPNHRKFFHSWMALGAMSYGWKKAYDREPETDLEKFLRYVALVGGAAAISHLVLDSLTPKSLPLI